MSDETKSSPIAELQAKAWESAGTLHYWQGFRLELLERQSELEELLEANESEIERAHEKVGDAARNVWWFRNQFQDLGVEMEAEKVLS